MSWEVKVVKQNAYQNYAQIAWVRTWRMTDRGEGLASYRHGEWLGFYFYGTAVHSAVGVLYDVYWSETDGSGGEDIGYWLLSKT